MSGGIVQSLSEVHPDVMGTWQASFTHIPPSGHWESSRHPTQTPLPSQYGASALSVQSAFELHPADIAAMHPPFWQTWPVEQSESDVQVGAQQPLVQTWLGHWMLNWQVAADPHFAIEADSQV
jgi:hypothetical protein